MGMQSDRVLTAHFVLSKTRYSRDADKLAFFNQLEQRLSALPGIEAAALSDSVPPSGAMVARRYVTQDYFRRLAFPFFAGVPSPPRIANANTYSVVLSNALMRRLFSSEDPLGKHILKGPQGQWFMVVGIAGDVKTLRSPDLAP